MPLRELVQIGYQWYHEPKAPKTMTLATLEETIGLERRLVTHSLAEKIYAVALELLDEGSDFDEVYRDLESLHDEYWQRGQVVERDALVEALDGLNELRETEHVPAAG